MCVVISGYRYYSAELGRWINKDPIGIKGGINLYCITSNNPFKIEILGLFDYNGFYADPRTPKDFAELTRENPETAKAMMEAWEKEKEPVKITDVFTPTNWPEGGPIPTYFAGVEAHLLGGGGLSLVVCCDDKCDKNYFLFLKVCGGAALGGGGAIGLVEGMEGATCNYKNYEGWFFEAGGSVGFCGAGLDVGVKDSDIEIPLIDVPLPSTEFSNVIEGGAGPSAGPLSVKATWCRYYKIWEKKEPRGCAKKR
ncbi:MAG: RHS repeat-associated core domain-containing protein [Desulfosalsimonadaceae bacterium]